MSIFNTLLDLLRAGFTDLALHFTMRVVNLDQRQLAGVNGLFNLQQDADPLSDSLGFTVQGPQIWGFATAIPREPKICLSGNNTATLNKYNNFMDGNQ
jgi:hypothetical protein